MCVYYKLSIKCVEDQRLTSTTLTIICSTTSIANREHSKRHYHKVQVSWRHTGMFSNKSHDSINMYMILQDPLKNT